MASYVCRDCVAGSYLQDALDFSEEEECSFCGHEVNVLDLEELVEDCDTALFASFRYVSQPASVLIYDRDPFGDHLHEVL